MKEHKEWFDRELRSLLLRKDKSFKGHLKQKLQKTKNAFVKPKNLKKKAFYLNEFNSCEYNIKRT